MPTYDYLCEACGFHFEQFQSITAEPLKKCPKCSGTVRRLIGGGNGFLFKGNGFYITDYRSEKYKKEKQMTEFAPSSSADSKASSTSEKKVA